MARSVRKATAAVTLSQRFDLPGVFGMPVKTWDLKQVTSSTYGNFIRAADAALSTTTATSGRVHRPFPSMCCDSVELRLHVLHQHDRQTMTRGDHIGHMNVM